VPEPLAAHQSQGLLRHFVRSFDQRLLSGCSARDRTARMTEHASDDVIRIAHVGAKASETVPNGVWSHVLCKP
jgi:hypothetical protein